MKKRGLSAVVTTLIIILLVLVAVGGIWIVVNNFIQEGTATITLSQKCLAVSFDLGGAIVSAVAANPGDYEITLKRNVGGDTISGVKINLFNSTGDNSGVQDFGVPMDEFETKTRTIITGTDVENANRMEYTAFFTDASGNDELCSGINEFNF